MCRSTILVQPSITKIINRKRKRGAEDSTTEKGYQMEIDPTLRKFVTTGDCLWKVVDQHYDNPSHDGKISFISTLDT